MANRNWRSGGYQTFNQILTPMSYYPQPINYPVDRKNYGGRGGYREENLKCDRKDFQTNRRERFSPNPNKGKSPYQRPAETNGNIRKDYKKSHGNYEVKVPHLTFDIQELSTASLKFRYPKMQVPSDFFHTKLNVQDAFPIYRPIQLGNYCEFQLVNKDVEDSVNLVIEPEDINYKYSAKVMLMSTSNIPELYKLACHIPPSEEPTGHYKYGLYRNIHFLVGSKGKNEPSAIGGAWSPSLDGSNPEEDPNVLIRTAIRTCKSLTGIDLSRCKKWYKFIDIHYYRSTDNKTQNHDESLKTEESTDEEKLGSTVETVTIFIPDIWSCKPTDEEWSEVKERFDKKLQHFLFPPPVVSVNLDIEKEEPVEESKIDTEEKTDDLKDNVEETTAKVEETASPVADLNQMKVTELRTELTARGLDTKGLKLQLVQRLQEAIDNEKKASDSQETDQKAENSNLEENHVEENNEAEESPNTVITCQLPEKEQKRLRWLYRVNEKPSFMVYPSKNSKEEMNNFSVMSLEKLLECHTDDQKEHSFEVALFVEQFNEMIQRDAAFVIYKALLDLPETSNTEEPSSTEEPETKKARLEETDARTSKMIVDMGLLFAFFVFDCENVGFLRDCDLESILHCIGLNLSRSQVKKLLTRIPTRKGSVMYRDVVERDVVEGGHEDVTSLRTSDPNVDRLMELSQGNKAFFEEADYRSERQGGLSCLDKLTKCEERVNRYQVQLTMLGDELKKIRSVEATAGDVATHLRDNIRKIEEKLTTEREAMVKLREVSSAYSGLLKMARDHMEVPAQEIGARFEHERMVAEKAREEAERVAKEAADKAREEAERALAASKVPIDFTEDLKMDEASL